MPVPAVAAGRASLRATTTTGGRPERAPQHSRSLEAILALRAYPPLIRHLTHRRLSHDLERQDRLQPTQPLLVVLDQAQLYRQEELKQVVGTEAPFRPLPSFVLARVVAAQVVLQGTVGKGDRRLQPTTSVGQVAAGLITALLAMMSYSVASTVRPGELPAWSARLVDREESTGELRLHRGRWVLAPVAAPRRTLVLPTSARRGHRGERSLTEATARAAVAVAAQRGMVPD